MGLVAKFLLWVIVLSAEAWAIDRPCADLSSLTISVDDKWIATVPRWYFTLMSREFANSVARNLLGKAPEQMNPNDAIFQSCVKSELNKDPQAPVGTFTITAYGGFHKNYLFKPVRAFEGLDMCSAGGEFCERGYNTLSDQQTFLVTSFCMSNGDMKWVAFSTVQTLPEATKQLIFQHVENLGFKRENFIELRWDYCPPV